MTLKRPFHQVDVFSAVPLKGNPLAVVHAAQGLSEAQMAAFAHWTNLSETTFLLPPTQPGADYRVRIFTPARELPFAGHPTLGSCWAWLAAGGQAKEAGVVVQECGVGLVRVQRDAVHPARLAFAAPPLMRSGPLEPELLGRITQALGLQAADVLHHQWIDNGPGWVGLMLRSAAQVLAMQPDWTVLGDVKLGLVGAQAAGSDTQFEVRAFVPDLGVYEDPVTGSLNAGMAQWLIGAGLAPPQYVAAQGAALGRAGRVYIRQVEGQVWVGGDVVCAVEGAVHL
jgi:PhzF family phenazine biosynthesis protein